MREDFRRVCHQYRHKAGVKFELDEFLRCLKALHGTKGSVVPLESVRMQQSRLQ